MVVGRPALYLMALVARYQLSIHGIIATLDSSSMMISWNWRCSDEEQIWKSKEAESAGRSNSSQEVQRRA